MAPPLLSANPVVNSDRSSTRRNKKKKIQSQNPVENQQNSPIEWNSESQQQIYSSKLLQALRQVRQGGGGAAFSPRRVHEAADRALAATARGRTRWSRAILTNRLKLKFMKKNNIVKRQNRVITVVTNGGGGRLQRKSKLQISSLRSRSLPAVQRKARVLSRLVPGCEKESLPVVLEEAASFIPALEMQVKVMTALEKLLRLSGSSSSNTASSTGDVNPFGFVSGRTEPGPRI